MILLFHQHSSLKTRVTLFALTTLVISLWILAFSAGRLLRADMERTLGEQQTSTVSILGSRINSELQDRITALELVASNIDSSLLAKPASLQKLLEDRPILKVQFNGGTFVAGLDGTAIADFPVVPGRVGTNYIDRETVAFPLREGKSIIGRPNMGKTLKAPIFSIAVPIRAKQGQVIGVLVGTIDLGKSNFLDSVASGHYGKSGGYLILAPQHSLFVTASNNKSLIMQPLPAKGNNRVMDRRIAEGFDGSAVNINSLGVEVLTSSARIPAAGWILIATLPTAEAFAPIHSTEKNLLILTLLLTALAGSVIWWILSRQLAPMLFTAKMLADLAQVDAIPPPLPITRQDEIGDMVLGFNRLLASLERRDAILRSENEKNRVLLQYASDGIHILNLAGNVVEVSNAFCAMLGYARDEMIGMNIARWDAQFTASELSTIVKQHYDQNLRLQFLTRHRRKYGSTYDAEISAVPLTIAGEPVMFYSARDITERRISENEILKLNNDLERRVRERTTSLEAANRELESFSYSIAHDLRTPLRGIAGYTRIIEEGYAAHFDQEGKFALERMRSAVMKMGELIEALLMLSQVGHSELHITAVDLSALARSVADSLEAGDPVRTVTVRIAPLIEVRADERLLRALIENLLGNAWKFTAKRADARIEVGVTQKDNKPAYFVRDNGVGFDMVHIGSLFRPFHRLHSNTEFAGTGIGLATVQRIVERHGGHVWAEAAVEQGATFFFTLSA